MLETVRVAACVLDALTIETHPANQYKSKKTKQRKRLSVRRGPRGPLCARGGWQHLAVLREAGGLGGALLVVDADGVFQPLPLCPQRPLLSLGTWAGEREGRAQGGGVQPQQ